MTFAPAPGGGAAAAGAAAGLVAAAAAGAVVGAAAGAVVGAAAAGFGASVGFGGAVGVGGGAEEQAARIGRAAVLRLARTKRRRVRLRDMTFLPYQTGGIGLQVGPS